MARDGLVHNVAQHVRSRLGLRGHEGDVAEDGGLIGGSGDGENEDEDEDLGEDGEQLAVGLEDGDAMGVAGGHELDDLLEGVVLQKIRIG